MMSWPSTVTRPSDGLRMPQMMPISVVLPRSEEHTSELQSRRDLVCRLLLEKKKEKRIIELAIPEGKIDTTLEVRKHAPRPHETHVFGIRIVHFCAGNTAVIARLPVADAADR